MRTQICLFVILAFSLVLAAQSKHTSQEEIKSIQDGSFLSQALFETGSDEAVNAINGAMRVGASFFMFIVGLLHLMI